MDFAHRHGLERRYDGPIPPADPAAIPVMVAARSRLFARLASETVTQAARRRGRLMPEAALCDFRLMVLCRSLATYRAHCIAWR